MHFNIALLKKEDFRRFLLQPRTFCTEVFINFDILVKIFLLVCRITGNLQASFIENTITMKEFHINMLLIVGAPNKYGNNKALSGYSVLYSVHTALSPLSDVALNTMQYFILGTLTSLYCAWCKSLCILA